MIQRSASCSSASRAVTKSASSPYPQRDDVVDVHLGQMGREVDLLAVVLD